MASPPLNFRPLVGEVTSLEVHQVHGDRLLLETREKGDIDSALAALSCATEPVGYCMCAGTVVFGFCRPSKEPFEITVHHGESVRWSGAQNHPLTDRQGLMGWLSARGITAVREEFEASQREAQRSLTEAEQWKRLMPSVLLDHFPAMRASGESERPEWTAAIEQAFPELEGRASYLLDWFGSGVGRWSGYPSWEAVPEKLLLKLPLDVILRAIGESPRATTLEGAARLFCGSSFGREQRRKLPAQLVSQMREHVARTGDRYKQSRFASAFGG